MCLTAKLLYVCMCPILYPMKTSVIFKRGAVMKVCDSYDIVNQNEIETVMPL